MVIIFSFSISAKELTLGIQKNTTGGRYQKVIVVKKNKIYLSKNSNYFDLNFNVGQFENSDKSNYKKTNNNLVKIIDELSLINDRLKPRGMKYNDLVDVGHHETLILLDGFKITSDSEYYAPLKEIIDNNWNSKKIKILNSMAFQYTDEGKNNGKLVFYKNGKIIKNKKILVIKDCPDKVKTFNTCINKEYGSIIIK